MSSLSVVGVWLCNKIGWLQFIDRIYDAIKMKKPLQVTLSMNQVEPYKCLSLYILKARFNLEG